jgi:hypothetical protein
MKGAVKKNISPPTGHPDKNAVMAASPASVETIRCSGSKSIAWFVIAS